MKKNNNCEMRQVSLIEAPIDKVWDVWTNPVHIAKWWGPNGFSNTIHKMELYRGGEWLLTMHGPDGKNYPNRSIFLEIIPKQKIVFEHFNPHFITTVLFEQKDRITELDWSAVFDSPEMFGIIVKTHKADEGQKQNIEKLKVYITTF